MVIRPNRIQNTRMKKGIMIEEITQNLMIMRRILTINLNLATSEATKDEIMVTEEEEGAKVPLKPTEILTLKKKA